VPKCGLATLVVVGGASAADASDAAERGNDAACEGNREAVLGAVAAGREGLVVEAAEAAPA
jgi:hypothetical protein